MDPKRSEAARRRFLERAEAAGSPPTSILAGECRAPSSSAATTVAQRILGGLRPSRENLARLAASLDKLSASTRTSAKSRRAAAS